MKKYFNITMIFLAAAFLAGCEAPSLEEQTRLYLGGDFSYVNELEDCGATYFKNDNSVDPFLYFSSQGSNLARLRLWHNPDWTNYSTLEDVKKSISRAQKSGMDVLLDFHYSDSWTDPAHQIIPAAWASISDDETLGDSLFNYTFSVINELYKADLLPEIVQIGNEINSEILMKLPADQNPEINWARQSHLLNRGLNAIKEFNEATGSHVKTLIHIAQPDSSKWWFENANLLPFDYIGLSYYPNWSEYNLTQLTEIIAFLKSTHKKEVMIVETGYPYSSQNFDQANNVLGPDSGLKGYPISPEGQLSFMLDLTSSVIKGGGAGVIYWEPAWLSSTCKTKWATGSHWENATFFDAGNGNKALPVFKFFNHNYFK